MDTHIINESMALSLAGKITFPDVVMRLAATGTERYIADLVGRQMFYYGINDETYTSPLEFDAPKVAEAFDAEAVKRTIKDIQQKNIDYRTFLHRIMAAGCSHYEVFILGRKALYFGRDGSQHSEPFPGGK